MVSDLKQPDSLLSLKPLSVVYPMGPGLMVYQVFQVVVRSPMFSVASSHFLNFSFKR